MCGIWVKPGTGQNMNPTIKLSNTYEMFFYASKGSPALNKAGRSNVFQHQTVPPAQKVHPTERPIELMKDIYETFSWSGSRILIPFLGSGNGILAANDLNMSPIGFELSKGYKDSFLVRVNNISMRR
jgi:site-specific DNA-methyltransferase (adenine-specific)